MDNQAAAISIGGLLTYCEDNRQPSLDCSAGLHEWARRSATRHSLVSDKPVLARLTVPRYELSHVDAIAHRYELFESPGKQPIVGALHLDHPKACTHVNPIFVVTVWPVICEEQRRDGCHVPSCAQFGHPSLIASSSQCPTFDGPGRIPIE